jgi:hypothetical protein
MAKLQVIEPDTAEVNDNSYSIRDVTVELVGITAYSASKAHDEEKSKSETWDTLEARIWQKKAHIRNDSLYIPGVAFKLALDETARLSNERIPGKGMQTFTLGFAAGVAAISDLDLKVKIEDVHPEQVYCHANGQRKPGPRVNRLFPVLHEWSGSVTFRVFNDSITQEKFEEYFRKAGLIAGVGRGRPITGCAMGLGRFQPLSFQWSQVT